MTDQANTIDPTSDRPAYKQLADIIRDQIAEGRLKAGENLPSEAELAATYRVGKQTVKAALNLLKSYGLILSRRGMPWWVRPTQINHGLRHAEGKDGFGTEASRFAKEYGVAWGEYGLDRSYSTVPAPVRVADALGVPEGAPVVERLFIHSIDGVVLRLAWSYLDHAVFGDTIMCDMGQPPWPGGTIAQLKHLGHDITQVHMEAGIQWITIAESHIMNVDAGTPALEIWRTQITNGKAVEVARHLHPARAGHRLVFDQRVGDPVEAWLGWAGRSYD